MPNSVVGTLPAQLVRHADLGPLAYLRPEDIAAGYLHVREEQPSGTAGGSSTASAYNDRVLNTIVGANTISGSSLSSNQVTLPQGTYECLAFAPSYASGGGAQKLFLYNVTDSTNILIGETSNYNSTPNAIAICRGRFILTGQKTIKLRHYLAQGLATNGLGVPLSLAGVAEVYASLELWKVA